MRGREDVRKASSSHKQCGSSRLRDLLALQLHVLFLHGKCMANLRQHRHIAFEGLTSTPSYNYVFALRSYSMATTMATVTCRAQHRRIFHLCRATNHCQLPRTWCRKSSSQVCPRRELKTLPSQQRKARAQRRRLLSPCTAPPLYRMRKTKK